MGYPNKGENHHSGIKNEKEVIKYQNQKQNEENEINKYLQDKHNGEKFQWIHKGGTKVKEDAIVKYKSDIFEKISIKNHQNGTFDWINTTALIKDELKIKIKDFKQENMKKSNKGKDITSEMREECSNIFSNAFTSLTSDDIKDLLNNIYQSYPTNILVNNKKEKKLILFDKLCLSEYFDKENKNKFILKSTDRAKTSRQIWIVKEDGTEINTNLRIRMTLNNGIGALFKKTSVPCIKIQQDCVEKFIESCSNKIITEY